MIKFFSDKITDVLVYNKSIDSEDSDVCSYGLEILISALANLVMVLILGAIFGKFIQTIVFVICYCSIRQFSGGYHADTHGRCIFTFLCMYLATVVFITNIKSIDLRFMVMFITILNWLIIYRLVPVEHINNPLNEIEKNKNRRNARVIVSLVLVAILIGLYLYLVYEYILYGAVALCWVSFMLILQIIKNKGEK